MLKKTIFDILVFLRQGMDAGIKQVLRNGQPPSKRLRGKNRSVVLFDEGPQEIPHFRAWTGQVDMAPPHPSLVRFLAGTQERSSLWIVDHDNILSKLHPLPVLLVGHHKK